MGSNETIYTDHAQYEPKKPEKRQKINLHWLWTVTTKNTSPNYINDLIWGVRSNLAERSYKYHLSG